MSNHPTLESIFVESLPPFNDVEVKFAREQKPATRFDKIVCGHVGYLLDKDSTANDLLEWVKRGVRAERLIVDSMAEASVWMLPDALSYFKHLVHLRLESSCDSSLLPALLLLGRQLPHLRIRLNGKRHALLPSLVQLSLQDACPSATMPPFECLDVCKYTEWRHENKGTSMACVEVAIKEEFNYAAAVTSSLASCTSFFPYLEKLNFDPDLYFIPSRKEVKVLLYEISPVY